MQPAPTPFDDSLSGLPPAAAVARPGLRLGERLAAYAELGKLRLTAMAALAVAVGFLAAEGPAGWDLVSVTLGAFLLSASSAFLNQFQEGELDARMRRTRGRPIPSGRVSEVEALTSGILLAMGGFLLLQAGGHPTAAFVGLGILLGYNLVYTPLKRLTELNTYVGAVVGALPVVLGAVAVEGAVPPAAWALFSVLLVWQLPHFWAIAWLHREDYRAGGFAMISRDDQTGVRTAASALVGAVLLLVVSLVPARVGLAGNLYLFGAGGLGALMVLACGRFLADPSDEKARDVFRYSLAYLPLVFLLLLVDKVGS